MTKRQEESIEVEKRDRNIPNFKFEINWPYEQELVPAEDYVDIHIDINKKKYWTSFTTTKFIEKRMKEYEYTGENSRGAYFCAKNMIVVARIDEDHVRRTLEDLFEKGIFEQHASEL